VTRAAKVVFALLVCATFAAFFVAQRVKATPAIIVHFRVARICSPNGDGIRDGCPISFRLKKTDDVTLRVIDSRGDPVRTLASNSPLAAYHRFRVSWDGRDDAGRRVPDGPYRYRLNLRRQGRSLVLPTVQVVDTTPPVPHVTAIGPESATPQIFPDPEGRPLTIHVATPTVGAPTTVAIYRTDPRPALVAQLPALHGPGTATWNGTVNGAPAPPGTYVVGLSTRDFAGNLGTSPGPLPPRGAYGQTLPGHAGITIRRLAVQPPLEPIIAGEKVTFGVDARRRPYTWDVRRVGRGRPRMRGQGRTARLQLRAPRGVSGAYVLDVQSAGQRTAVPFAVQAVSHRPVLVVLPAILWQGSNPVDDDGDGLPNTLWRGVGVLRSRVFANGIPNGFNKRISPLLKFLDDKGDSYDLTTDLALAAGDGPQPAGHKGVILAGDERWLPARAQVALRQYVSEGGRVASFGVDSLRRQVRLTAARIVDPTTPAPTDTFGFTLGALVTKPVTLTNLVDKINLFGGDVFGGTGQFERYRVYEPVDGLPSGAKTLASAVTPAEKPVIVAAQVGRGMVIHIGLPGLTARLGHPGNETALVARTWSVISR